MKSSLLVLAGLLSAGVVAGGTASVLQKSPMPAPPVAVAPSPDRGPQVTKAPDRAPDRPTLVQSSPVESSPTPIAKARVNPDDRVQSNASGRQVTRCEVAMAIVKDDNPPLNVRSRPGMDGEIIGQLKQGTFVSVKQEQDGWLAIAEPPGWIAKNKTASRCGRKVEQVRFSPGSRGATLSDEFLGTGSHQYKLSLGQGQTLRLTGAVGPMPAVIAPDGTYLLGIDEARSDWSVVLPSSGEYTLQMDSNFRGYKYEFAVEVT
jgi:hypothetical protein